MMPRSFLLALPLLLSACGVLPITRIDTARVPPGAFADGAADPDVSAVYFAQWAFADPARTAGRPADAARAVAAMDYIAGQLNTGGRWSNIPALTQLQLLQGRAEVRRALFVAPGTPSQAVVDRFVFASNALARGDQPAALSALDGPAFTAPAPTVLARLDRLPALPAANVATMHAAGSLYSPDDTDWR